MPTIFAAHGITKRFGSNTALDRVDFEVVEGEINGLVGANGAGKSTLLKIIIGALRPDAGGLELAGKPIALPSVRDAAALGIAMVSQELSLFPALSVEENLLLAPGGTGWADRRGFRPVAHATLRRLGVEMPLGTPVRRLGLADRQLVEIARALLQMPRVLILDEPTSSLHATEVERLHAILRALRDDGIGIVYVSHFLEELLEISDSLTVLRGGRRVQGGIAPSVDQLDNVVAAMLGRAPDAALQPANAENQSAARILPKRFVGPLRITKLSGAGNLRIADLEIAPGTVTGVAGLAGSGFEELFRILFGRAKARSGTVVLPSGAGLPASTAAAVEAGVAYTPADRKLLGLALRQSIVENVVSVRTLSLRRDGIVPSRAVMRRIAEEQCARVGVVAASVDQRVEELSGGNQQKVVFAKWIEAQPSLLVLDDPTRGVDVAAREEMHRLIQELACSGMVVLFYSSDPGEIVTIAERVLVFVDGALARELRGGDLSEHNLVAAMNTGAALGALPSAA